MKEKTLYELVTNESVPLGTGADEYLIKLGTNLGDSLLYANTDFSAIVSYVINQHNEGSDFKIISTHTQDFGFDKVRRIFVVSRIPATKVKRDYYNCYKQVLESISKYPEPVNVIFNPPATIVFWQDGTKSVVKVQNGEKYDPEKGLAMAFSKKMFGNKYDYYNVFAKWLKKWDRLVEVNNKTDRLVDALRKITNSIAQHPVRDQLSENYRNLEERCSHIKQLTGYYFEDLVEKLAAGEVEITAVTKKSNEINCKDCKYFVPANELDKTLYPNSLDADGACFGVPELTYVDAFETCKDAEPKDVE